MRKIVLLFLSILLLISCNKGEILTNDLTIQLVESANTSIYPTGAFPHFDPNDPFELDVYPHYVNYASVNEINSDFKKYLTNYLVKNKIHLVPDSCKYRLEIASISYSESNNRSSYQDSCSFGTPYSYVYYSDFTVSVHAALYMGNVLLESYVESESATEHLRTKVDECNKPLIRSPFQSLEGVAQQCAKRIRAKVSIKLKELEG